LLSKNSSTNVNIDTYDDIARGENLSKNSSTKINIDTYDDIAREDNLDNNSPSKINIDTYDDIARGENLSKNSLLNINIDTYDDIARVDNLSNNVPTSINIDTYDDIARTDNLSNNAPTSINIDTYDDIARTDNLSNNAPTSINIDTYDDIARVDNLDNNVPIGINIDTYDDIARVDNLDNNVPIGINIDTYDDIARIDNLDNNVPIGINIDTYDDIARVDNLDNNVPIGINIDTYDDIARVDNLDNNVPIGINIDTYDDIARIDNLDNNVPIGINIDTYDDIARVDNLDNNVPIGINIDTYDDIARIDNLDNNVPIGINIDTYDDIARVDNLDNNVPIGINIDTYDDIARVDNLDNNVPIGINIDTYDDIARIDNLDNNVPIGINIDTYDDIARIDNVDNNVRIGINIDTYDEEARYLNNLSKNVPSFINIDTYATAGLVINRFRNGRSIYSIDFFINYFGLPSISPVTRLLNITRRNKYNILYNPYRDQISYNQNYGISSIDDGVSLSNRITQRQKEKTKIKTRTIQNLYGINGFITDAIRNYNVLRNYYSIYGKSPDNLKDFEDILNDLSFEFKDDNGNLIIADYAKFSSMFPENPIFNGYQQKIKEKTNSSPDIPSENTESYLNNNNVSTVGGYISSDAIEILKPEEGVVGDAISMMTQTEPSNSISDKFLDGEGVIPFFGGGQGFGTQAKRGVRKIIDTISKGNAKLSQNFKRNQNVFIVGNDKKTFQRYTYRNSSVSTNNIGNIPILTFSLRNYSNGIEMLFPPYVKSYSDNAAADYTQHDFLGRPESVYTYSKSNRKGNISFVVLTDYAESVEFGWEFNEQTGDATRVIEKFPRNFTSRENSPLRKKELNAEIDKLKKENLQIQQDINVLLQNANLVGSSNEDVALFQRDIRENNREIVRIQSELVSTTLNSNNAVGYGEINKFTGIKTVSAIQSGLDPFAGEIDTIGIINEMKNNLLFQPSYFSGSKVDFVNKMEFLMKLTRPARNTSGGGFSFTKPPISHIRLGDWFDSDIVINSVSVDYSDAPWTLDGGRGRVQPMWAVVTLDFTFIGSYGATGLNTPVLSTDIGGFYSRKTEIGSSSIENIAQEVIPTVPTPPVQSGGGVGGAPVYDDGRFA